MHPNADIQRGGVATVEHGGEHHRGVRPGPRHDPRRRRHRQARQEAPSSPLGNFHGHLGGRLG